MARAITRIATRSEIVDWAIIISFAHGLIAETPVGQHSQNYLTATTLGGTRYATMSAAGKKNKLKMKYPMKL